MTTHSSYHPARLPILLLVTAFAGSGPVALGQSTPAGKPVTAELGALTYKTYCSACHQENGRGVGGAFPPLAGHAASLASQPGGRDYLIRVLLSGLEGPITVEGQAFSGVMPPWQSLQNGEIASVLNYVTNAWDSKARLAPSIKPYDAGEIEAARAVSATPSATLALRQKLFVQPSQAVAEPVAIALTYTDAQAAQGKSTYDQSCKDCHGGRLDDGEFGGAPLKGSYFRNRWGNGNVASLYAYMRTKMPPDRPGALSDKVYADVLSYILQVNGYPSSDKELPTDTGAQQAMSLKRN